MSADLQAELAKLKYTDPPAYRRKLAAEHRMTELRDDLKHMTEVYARAVELKDWETLRFESLEAWRHKILGYTGLTRKARREIVGALTEIGMSTREIEAATGAGHGTVVRDQASAGGPRGPQANARQQAARDREASRRTEVVERKDSEPVPEPGAVVPPDEAVSPATTTTTAAPPAPRPPVPCLACGGTGIWGES